MKESASLLSDDAEDGGSEVYVLGLFIAGPSALSRRAIVNTRRLCEKYLAGRYELEIVDLCQNPRVAEQEQIVAAPTLVKRFPPPLRKFVGDMSRTQVILNGMGIPCDDQES